MSSDKKARWENMTIGMFLSGIIMVLGIVISIRYALGGIIIFVAGFLAFYINGLTAMVCSLIDRLDKEEA